jgi:hypothetical protein
MKKQMIGLLAMMLLAVGVVSAYTETDVSFYQADGSASVSTYAQVEGNYWDWPSAPVAETPTASIQTDVENSGSFEFHQKVIQYGNGQQWPHQAENEWSMYEVQQLSGDGETEYNKHFEVWTVHEGWNTDYNGGGNWNMPEGYDNYDFEGNTHSTEPTVFNYHVDTDSDFHAGSGVWVNPFTV